MFNAGNGSVTPLTNQMTVLHVALGPLARTCAREPSHALETTWPPCRRDTHSAQLKLGFISSEPSPTGDVKPVVRIHISLKKLISDNK